MPPARGCRRASMDLYAKDQAAEVARGSSASARPRSTGPDGQQHELVALADPEGNRFCVVDTGG